MKRELTMKAKHSQWNPKKKLSREDMLKLRELKENFPHYKTVELAELFRVSPEAVRRILKSNWVPNDIDEDRIIARREKQKQKRQQEIQLKKLEFISNRGKKNVSSRPQQRQQQQPKQQQRQRSKVGYKNGFAFNEKYGGLGNKF